MLPLLLQGGAAIPGNGFHGMPERWTPDPLQGRRHPRDHVFLVHSYAVASLFLLPSLFFSSRSRTLPPLGTTVLSKMGLAALIGSSSQMVGYAGINLSSPTLASAIGNLMPAAAFILTVLFGMEKVSLRTKSSQAKIIGTVVSISGAFIVTLYKGPPDHLETFRFASPAYT